MNIISSTENHKSNQLNKRVTGGYWYSKCKDGKILIQNVIGTDGRTEINYNVCRLSEFTAGTQLKIEYFFHEKEC